MRNLVAAFFAVWVGSTAAAAAPAYRSARVDKAAARRALLAARVECKKPSGRIESLVAHYFDPGQFGTRVIVRWSQLTGDQRAEFEREADRVVGGEARASALAQLCKRKVQIDKPWMNDDVPGGDDVVQMKIWDLEDGADSVTVSLQPDGSQWRLVAIRFYGVSNFHREWRFRFDPRTDGSDRLAQYDKAMDYLRSH
jgi:hypothetical protein